MSGLRAPARRSVPVPCHECGADVWHVYTEMCDACFGRAYAAFRELVNWPL